MFFKRSLALVALLILVIPFLFLSKAEAQIIETSSSLNPVGSGARATGMGGAFIGVADDATAASWNPAGLLQLERPEISAVWSYFRREQEYSSSDHPEVDSSNTMDTNGLNYASVVYPFMLYKRNVVISFNYQRLYEMDKEAGLTINESFFGETFPKEIDFTQDGYLYTLSPALAVQVTPDLSLGATLNIWDDLVGDNGWNNTTTLIQTGTVTPFDIRIVQEQDISFEGTNANLGFLWNINEFFTLGGVYKTPFDADLKRKTSYSRFNNIPAAPTQFINQTDNFTLKMPASYGLGLSYRHSDNLTAAFDLYMTDWSRFVLRDEAGNETNPLTGAPISDGRLKDTIQVRLGSEYLFIKEKYIIPLRFGLFYDPEPDTDGLNEYYGFSAGTGFANQRFAFDVSYQYRTANNVTGDVPSVEDITVDVEQHQLMISGIIYF